MLLNMMPLKLLCLSIIVGCCPRAEDARKLTSLNEKLRLENISLEKRTTLLEEAISEKRNLQDLLHKVKELKLAVLTEEKKYDQAEKLKLEKCGQDIELEEDYDDCISEIEPSAEIFGDSTKYGWEDEPEEFKKCIKKLRNKR
jgi:hypothetical protein